MPFFERLALTLSIGSAFFMAGIIWLVQLVVYPAMRFVGPERFSAHHAAHANHITLVVGPAMLIEAATAGWLLAYRPADVPFRTAAAGAVCVAAAFALTFFVSVPLHERLGAGFDAATIERLISTNWWRVVAWSGHAAIWGAWLVGRLNWPTGD